MSLYCIALELGRAFFRIFSLLSVPSVDKPFTNTLSFLYSILSLGRREAIPKTVYDGIEDNIASSFVFLVGSNSILLFNSNALPYRKASEIMIIVLCLLAEGLTISR